MVEPESSDQDRPDGPVAAAMLAGGLGSATLGVLTVLGETRPAVARALNWWNPAGPLVGKALTGVAVFLLSWVLLHLALRRRNVHFVLAATVAFVLLAAGIVGTFPPFFALFVAK
jgi:hypothetical protein